MKNVNFTISGDESLKKAFIFELKKECPHDINEFEYLFITKYSNVIAVDELCEIHFNLDTQYKEALDYYNNYNKDIVDSYKIIRYDTNIIALEIITKCINAVSFQNNYYDYDVFENNESDNSINLKISKKELQINENYICAVNNAPYKITYFFIPNSLLLKSNNIFNNDEKSKVLNQGVTFIKNQTINL